MTPFFEHESCESRRNMSPARMTTPERQRELRRCRKVVVVAMAVAARTARRCLVVVVAEGCVLRRSALHDQSRTDSNIRRLSVYHNEHLRIG